MNYAIQLMSLLFRSFIVRVIIKSYCHYLPSFLHAYRMEYLGLEMVKHCSMISTHANRLFLQALKLNFFDVQLW